MKIARLQLLSIGIIASIAFVFVCITSVHAADTSKFNAGRIIDDTVFFDPSGLSITEIQNFLNAKIPVCDTNGTQPYGSGTRASYATSRGYAPPYTCLKDYVQDIGAKSADNYCQGFPTSRKTAAEIIYGVAQSCGINPRVLIVLLQKEQGLITDDWPWSIQYQSATGMGCPDTAACDSQYYGFFNQVYGAARQFKKYQAWPNDYGYIAKRNNFIQWSPNASCGGSTVYIENQATAGLYNYTPYRPNQAALNAGYGQGDGCSAYGNRNFWLYYTDWFGDTFAPNYYWQPVSQSVYADDTLTVDSKPFVKGQRRFIQIKIKNAGAATWYKWSTNLGTSAPRDRQSSFYDPSWLSQNRVATIKEASVAPGQTATFEFWVNGSTIGNFLEYFTPLQEGVSWMNDQGLHIPFTVESERYSWSVDSQSLYTDSTYTQQLPWSATVAKGDVIFGRIIAKNTGNVTWYNNGANPIKAATSSPQDRSSVFCNSSWGGCSRPTILKESSVAPGQTGTFEFQLQPSASGSYNEYFRLVAEGKTWLNDTGMYFPINAPDRTYSWEAISQIAYSDAAHTQPLPYVTPIAQGQSAYVVLKVKNTSNGTWTKSVALATSNPKDRASAFKSDSWISSNRLATFNEPSIRPGETATFEFKLTANTVPGSYREYYRLVWEGQSWFNDLGLFVPIQVN